VVCYGWSMLLWAEYVVDCCEYVIVGVLHLCDCGLVMEVLAGCGVCVVSFVGGVLSQLCCQHVADTCQCRRFLADIACRCDTEEAPKNPIYINYTDKYKSAQTYGYLSFLCLSSKELPTCRCMSAKADIVVSFWTPCRHNIFLCLRHDQQRVATCRRHDTECRRRRLGNKIDTSTSNIVGCWLSWCDCGNFATYVIVGLLWRFWRVRTCEQFWATKIQFMMDNFGPRTHRHTDDTLLIFYGAQECIYFHDSLSFVVFD